MSHDHPFIDFDGDGHGDSYETSDLAGGGHEFTHHDASGHIDGIAYDRDGNGLVDSLDVDSDHDGVLDHHLTDTNGDGWMDTKSEIADPNGATHDGAAHPRLDFTGDGYGDRYQTVHTADGGDSFVHADGHGHADAVAYDYNGDGHVDSMDVDHDHDGVLDHHLTDTDGDGWMDSGTRLHGDDYGLASV